jgi:hypothetical protein
MFVDFLNFLSVVDMDGSIPMRCYTQSLDLRFKSYEVFNPSKFEQPDLGRWIFWAAFDTPRFYYF